MRQQMSENNEPLGNSEQLKPREFKIKDQTVIVDEEDYPIVSRMKWHLKKDKNTFYAYANIKVGGKQTSLGLHRFISGMTASQVDHKNRNGLDNRKSNLRYSTNQQNCCNRVRKNAFGYRGVYQPKGTSTYSFQIQCKGIKHHGHGFITPEMAAMAYDEASLRLHGEFGVRNFQKDLGCGNG